MNLSMGFNISEVLTILKGVDEIRLLKLSQRWAEATEFEQKLRKAVRDYRNHKRRKEFPSEFPGELLDKLTKEKSKAAKRKIREMVTSWTSYALGDTTSFSVQELAGLTQLPLEKIATFLDRF